MFISKRHALIMIICVIGCAFFTSHAIARGHDCHIISTIPAPGPNPQGVAWDGSHLWVADAETDSIYKINHLNGFIDYSFSSPGLEPRGLTYDGTHLWNIDNNYRKIFKLNPENGSIINFIELPSEVNSMAPLRSVR